MGMFIICVSFFTFLGCATLSDADRAERHRRDGVFFFERGNSSDALLQFDRAIELNPNSAMAHFDRGRLHNDRNRSDQALDDFKKALEIDPNFSRADDANAFIGSIYFGRNDHVNAEVYIDRALAINSNHAVALHRKNRIEEAKARAEREEARRIAQEEANRFDSANFIIVPDSFRPANYTRADLFEAVAASERLAVHGGVNDFGFVFPPPRIFFVSDVIFVSQSGTDITFRTADNAISRRMRVDSRTGLTGGERVRVYYQAFRAQNWQVIAIERL
jgi:tetratricopeptide (TPR) repeat protein